MADRTPLANSRQTTFVPLRRLSPSIPSRGSPGKAADAAAKPEPADAGESARGDKALGKRGSDGKFAKAADKPEG